MCRPIAFVPGAGMDDRDGLSAGLALDGMPRRVGWWAALLIAASPAVGVSPYTVRPDMLGVAASDDGRLSGSLGLAIRAAPRDHDGGRIRGIWSGSLRQAAARGHAGDQHDPPGDGGLLRGHISSKIVARGLLTGLAIVLLRLRNRGAGDNGHDVAGSLSSRLERAAWFTLAMGHTSRSFLSRPSGRSSGLIAMLMAVGLGAAGAREGVGSRARSLGGSLHYGIDRRGQFRANLADELIRLDRLVGFAIWWPP